MTTWGNIILDEMSFTRERKINRHILSSLRKLGNIRHVRVFCGEIVQNYHLFNQLYKRACVFLCNSRLNIGGLIHVVCKWAVNFEIAGEGLSGGALIWLCYGPSWTGLSVHYSYRNHSWRTCQSAGSKTITLFVAIIVFPASTEHWRHARTRPLSRCKAGDKKISLHVWCMLCRLRAEMVVWASLLVSEAAW